MSQAQVKPDILPMEDVSHHEQPTDIDEPMKEDRDLKNQDAAAEFMAQHGYYPITAEESNRVRRKIDLRLMPLMAMMYLLQQLDKSSVSFASVFGIQKDAHLVGQQYAWLTSIVYIAALVGQPASAYALSRLPINWWICGNFIGWSVCQLLTTACTNFQGLIALRFFLGLFEAAIAPTMMIVVSMWWTRREQPFRQNWWYLMNGFAGILGSLMTWGIGHIHSKTLKPYQLIFLFIGLISTACAVPTCFYFPASPMRAKFLNDDEKRIALERIRLNQTGTQGSHFKWKQVLEAFTDLKTLFIIGIILPHAVCAGGVSAFGPLILKSFGLTQFQTILYNMVPGAMQIVLGVVTSYMISWTKLKAPTLMFIMIVTLAGSIALWVLPRGPQYTHPLLGSYYLLQFSGSIAPLAFIWANANTAGGTKKATLACIEWATVCVGNAAGAQLFKSDEAPYYFGGLRANMISLAVMCFFVFAYAGWLWYLNKRNEKRRRAKGLTSRVVDYSLASASDWEKMRREQAEKDRDGGRAQQHHSQQAFLDLTDLENEEFVFSY